jgi:hypothetical protein
MQQTSPVNEELSERLARRKRQQERFEQASCHTTSPETLRTIIERTPEEEQQARTIAAVVGNPNTPLDILARYADDHIDAFCTNPILPLLPLEHPEFMSWLSPVSRSRILFQENPPPSLLSLLQKDRVPLVAEAASLHIGIAGEIDPANWEIEVRTYLYRFVLAPAPGPERAILRELVEFDLAPAWAADFGPGDREEEDLIAPEIPASRRTIVRLLLGIDGPPRIPDQGSEDLRQAFDPETPLADLERLADHQDWSVRLAVAVNPSLTRGLWEIVAKQTYRGLYHAALLRNPACPSSFREQMARGMNPALRRAARRIEPRPEWIEYARAVTEKEFRSWCEPKRDEFTYGNSPSPLCQFLAEWRPLANGAERERWPLSAIKSHNHRTRLAVALSPHLSVNKKMLDQLSHDGCRLVRAVAHARLQRLKVSDGHDWSFTL